MSEMTAEWEAELEVLHGRIAPCFSRSEPRKRALGYLKGLLSQCERKNGWQLAEQLGELNPDAVQRLLNQADWQSEQVMKVLRTYVIEQIGSQEGVLIVDETGFLKKGDQSAGVQRQYSGTAGRVENCQIGVFLAYATSSGSAFIGAKLYLPKDWLEDRQRSKLAGIPKQTKFATKPELARQMIQTAIEEKVPFSWLTGDSIYGGDRRLRRWLEEQEISFVLAVPKNEPLWYKGFRQWPASEIAGQVQPKDWQRLSAGEGAKGPRLYDWAVVTLPRLQIQEEAHLGHYLLLRRSLEDPTEITYYVVFAPREQASLEQLVKVAGQRWQIEQGFELAKGECGLDHYGPEDLQRIRSSTQVAGLVPPYHFSLTSPCFPGSPAGKGIKKNSASDELIPLTAPEIRQLLYWLLLLKVPLAQQVLHWSNWRRRHQRRAQKCHYKKRNATPP